MALGMQTQCFKKSAKMIQTFLNCFSADKSENLLSLPPEVIQS